MSNCSRNCRPTPLQDLGLRANASLYASARTRVQQVSCATPSDCRTVYMRCLQRFLSRPDGVCGLPKRKSTRLNSSHLGISYAVFCLKTKKLLIKVTRHL